MYLGSRDGVFYAIKADGTLKWTFPCPSDVTRNPAIGLDGTIYFAVYNGTLYALNNDGTLKWSFSSGAASGSSR